MRKGITAVVATLMVLLITTLTGCAPSTQAMNDGYVAEVLATDPNVTSVEMSNAVGIAGTSLHAVLTVKSTDLDDLVATIDSAMLAFLTGTPARPVGYGLELVDADGKEIDIEEPAKASGWYDEAFNNQLGGGIDPVEARFGTWEELHQ